MGVPDLANCLCGRTFKTIKDVITHRANSKKCERMRLHFLRNPKKQAQIRSGWHSPLITADQFMCKVARYFTEVFWYPKCQARPVVKIVPVSELRYALDRSVQQQHEQQQHQQTNWWNLRPCSDDVVLDAFTAVSTPDDSAARSLIWRFART